MKDDGTRPLSPQQATELLRRKVNNDLTLLLTDHAQERLDDRGLTTKDVLHVLKHGFVYEEAEPATRIGLFKYQMEASTPNSGGRTVRIVVIPSSANQMKLVTVMWADES